MNSRLLFLALLLSSFLIPTNTLAEGIEDVDAYLYSPHFNGLSDNLENNYSLQFNYSEETGEANDLDMDFSLQTTETYQKIRNTFEAEVGFEDNQDNSELDRDYKIQDSLEFHYNHVHYIFTSLIWEQDKLIGLLKRESLRVGIGSFLLQNDTTFLRVEVGYDRVAETLRAPGSNQTYGATLLATKWVWNINEQSNFTAEVDFLHNLDKRYDRRTDFTAEIDTSISELISITFTYEVNHDSNPIQFIDSTQRSFTAGLEVNI